MNTTDFIRDQLRQASAFLDGTMTEVRPDDLHAATPGELNTIGATYAHLVTGEDGFVNAFLRKQAPLFATTWASRTGISELPPESLAWNDWGKRVRVDLVAMKPYAVAVADATDAYVASLALSDLDADLDLSMMGMGVRTLGWVIGAGVLGHRMSHWGEICALNGLRGGKGFPV